MGWRQGASHRAGLLGCTLRIKAVSLGWLGARCEKPLEENPHPACHLGKHQPTGLRGRRPPWPPPAISFTAFIPADPGQEDAAEAEGVTAAGPNQLGGGKGGQRGLERGPGKTLLAGPAWLGPHDFAAASPNISFHGNPGEKRGAFILASEFTLLERRRHWPSALGARERGLCTGAGESLGGTDGRVWDCEVLTRTRLLRLPNASSNPKTQA